MSSNVAIVQEGFVREDPLSTLKVETTLQPIPTAGAGEVVVHITMRPILPMDFLTLRGFGVHNGSPGAEGFRHGPCMRLKEILPVPKGEHIIVTAAGSTLARQLIALANRWDIQLIDIVRRPQQNDEIKALGAQHEVICSSEEDVVARVKEMTSGRGAWLALDAVGGPGRDANLGGQSARRRVNRGVLCAGRG